MRPAGSGAPPLTPRLRPMTRADVTHLLGIERDLFAREAWSEGLFRSELAETDSRWYIVAIEGEDLVGYAGLCVYPDDAWIQTMAVRRDRWGRGIGRVLLDALLAEAARRGRDVVGLEVRADNTRAQDLYRRYGFEPITVRAGYYQPSNVDAVIMTRRSSG